MYGMAIVVAPAIGPTLGGWITDNYNWHWIFFINVPIGVLSLVLTQRVVQDPIYLKNLKRSTKRVDYLGMGLIAVGAGLLQFVLDMGEQNDLLSSNVISTCFAIPSASQSCLGDIDSIGLLPVHRCIMGREMSQSFSRSSISD